MRYLCLVYTAADKPDTSAGYPTDSSECLDYREELLRSGYLVAADALECGCRAAAVRVRNGEVVVAAGPVDRAGEHLIGFALIDARDLNHAIRVASGMPAARVGGIEVWPIRPPRQQQPRQACW